MFTSEQLWKAIDGLAHAHGITASRLSIMAGLDPTALNKSKRTGSDGRPRWMSTETVAKILSVTGTTFGDFVRLVNEVGSDAAAHSTQQSSDGWLASKARILLVDEDVAFCSRAASLLGPAGYDVSIMTDFRHALEIVESARPLDLLIVNLALPYGVRGTSLARLAHLRRPELKIVLLSNDAQAHARAEGVGLVLYKPIDETRLVSEAMRLLQS